MSDRKEAIRARLAAATPGPWVVGDDPSQVIAPCPCCGLIATCAPFGLPTGDREYDIAHHYNSALIAAAPSDLAYLLAEVERLEMLVSLANPLVLGFLHGVGPFQHQAEQTARRWVKLSNRSEMPKQAGGDWDE